MFTSLLGERESEKSIFSSSIVWWRRWLRHLSLSHSLGAFATQLETLARRPLLYCSSINRQTERRNTNEHRKWQTHTKPANCAAIVCPGARHSAQFDDALYYRGRRLLLNALSASEVLLSETAKSVHSSLFSGWRELLLLYSTARCHWDDSTCCDR